MITLTAKIDILSGDSTKLNNATNNMSGNNISSTTSAVWGKKQKTKSPFIIGKNKIGDGSTLQGNLGYFMGKQFSNEKGQFATACVITLSCQSNISHFTISFDTENNRHPQKIVVDDVEYNDDDSIFTITNLSNTTTHTIKISDWNAPNSPLVISGIYVGLSVELDYSVLQNIEIKHIDRAYIDKPSYGIISNTGSIVFTDKNGEIKDYAQQKLLKAGLKVAIYLKDTLHKRQEQVGNYETSDWDYDVENKEVSASLKDNLQELQSINSSAIPLKREKSGAIITNSTAYDLFEDLCEKTPSKYGFSQTAIDEYTKKILQNTSIKMYYLEEGTLWQQWTKLCELVQGRIWKGVDGATIFKVD